MPVRPKKRISTRAGGLGITGPELEDLIFGYSFFEEPFKNAAAREKCWKKNRNFILNLEGKAVQGESFGLSRGVYFEVGTRPAAWWNYDSPGRRRFISCTNDFCPFFAGCPVAKNIPTEGPNCVIREGEDRAGKSSYDGWLKIECVGHDFKIWEPIRETEWAFLQRHNLLNEKEKGEGNGSRSAAGNPGAAGRPADRRDEGGGT